MAELTKKEFKEFIEKYSEDEELKKLLSKFVKAEAEINIGFKSGSEDPVEEIRQYNEALRLQAEYYASINDRQAEREQLENNLKILMQQQKKLAARGDQKEAIIELEKQERLLREELEKFGPALSDAAKIGQRTFNPFMSSLARKMGMASKTQDTTTAKLIKGFKMLQSKDGLKGVFEGFKSVFSVVNVAEGIFTKFVESSLVMAKAFDKASASFAAATGAGESLSDTLLNAQQSGNMLGVTFDNAGNSIKGLFNGFVGFVDQSDATQAALIQDAALFERIGINAETSAKLLTTFTRNLDMSAAGAMKMTKALSQMGKGIGVSAQKMMSDFETAFKSLAVYGDKSIEVFQGLAAAAKAAGVEVATLTSIAGKFDTFSGAADSVGKLNALLGSQISSTEMLLMTEDQRIETLIQQVQLSGVNFKDMNKFQQMAIANAAGIQDMSEAQRIFGMSFNEYGKYKDRMQAQQNVQENFNKAIEATLPLTEKLSIFVKEFAVAVKPLNVVFEFFTDLLLGFARLGDGIVLQITGFIAGFTLLAKVMSVLPGISKMYNFLKAKTIGLMTTENSLQKVNNGQKIFEQTISKKNVPIMSLENQQRFMANKLKQEEAGTNQILAPTQTEVGITSSFAASGMLKFGLAVLMVGAGIGVAAAGIGYMVSSFTELSKIGPEAVSSMVAFAGALSTLMAAGALGILGGGGLALGLYAVYTALEEMQELMNQEGSVPLQNGLENLALIVSGRSAKQATEKAVTAITELKSAFSGLMEQKITISLDIKDNALADMVEEVVINGLRATPKGKIYEATIKAVNSVP